VTIAPTIEGFPVPTDRNERNDIIVREYEREKAALEVERLRRKALEIAQTALAYIGPGARLEEFNRLCRTAAGLVGGHWSDVPAWAGAESCRAMALRMCEEIIESGAAQ